MRNASPRVRIGDVATNQGRLSFILDNSADLDRAREILLPLVNGTGLTREWELRVIDGQRIVLTPTPDGLSNAVTQAMDSATEVVRKRIDEQGTRAPTNGKRDGEGTSGSVKCRSRW